MSKSKSTRRRSKHERAVKLVAEQGGDVYRRFVRVGTRGVHYLRAGQGSPVVLLHAAMSSSWAMLPLLQKLASDHTVFAFDHPGFGDSDPLPKRRVTIEDVAGGLMETLVALKVPRCPIYGSHTGGSVALELARRHPARVSAAIIDGVPVFNAREAEFFTSDGYMPLFDIHDDGSHLFSTWVKTRDSMMWFPWNKRTARNRRRGPLPSPADVHRYFLERLRAGDDYRAVYTAAFLHDAHRAVTELTVPATFMTRNIDPLFPHLRRLPALKPNQQIRRYTCDALMFQDEVVRVIRDYRVRAKAPADGPFRPANRAINRRYVDAAGGQILVRSAGHGRRSRPLILLHEGSASSRTLEPLMQALGRRRPVYAPDLPDNGASDALAARRPKVSDYVDVVVHVAKALDLGQCDIYAVGAGAAVAIGLLARPTFSRARVLLEAPDFYESRLARRLTNHVAPPIAAEWDGAHLNRVWLMLRDQYAFWPWFDRTAEAARALDAPQSCGELHARATDLLRSLSTYQRLTMAALRYDWSQVLGRRNIRLAAIATTADDPRRPHAEAAALLAGLREAALLPPAPEAKARKLLELLAG